MKTAQPQGEPSPFEKMKALAAKVIHTPKAEVDKRERDWREQRRVNAPKKTGVRDE